MKSISLLLLSGLLALAMLPGALWAVPAPAPFGPVPTERQVKWHELEIYAFVHFTTNTFTDKEWGFGDEKESVFNPTDFNADQIVQACKDGGMKGLILTAKHHDGFCLWPSKYTEHSVKNSPWKNGKGDVVKEFSDACKRHGIKFGVYISPWDRNHAEYGRAGYVEYYKNQIRELLANYGPIFEMWFDGANGGDGYYGGQGGQRKVDYNTYYDWKGIRAIIRELQPDCAVWCGQYREGDRIIYADCQWGGSEGGTVGDPCWATLNSKKLNPGIPDCQHGHRDGDVWCPAEGDVSIRPGWFYHANQDNQVKSPQHLMNIYFACVGRGANLILNVPPDRRGQLHANDVKSLQGFGKLMAETFGDDLAKEATATASNCRGNDKAFAPKNLLDGKRDTYWATDDGITTPEVVLEFKKPVAFTVVRLREYLPLGQRIDDWALDAWQDGRWQEFAKGSAIGAGRLVRCTPRNTTKVRLRITKAAACPALAEFALFAEPASLSLPKIVRDRQGNVTVSGGSPAADLRYTLDGSEPGLNSPAFTAPLPLPKGGTIKARQVIAKEKKLGEIATAEFGLAKGNWKIVSASWDGPGNSASKTIDDNPGTFWATHDATEHQLPQELVIDLGAEAAIKAFTYLPRQDNCPHGMVDKYTFYLSTDGQTWGEPAATGEFGNLRANPILQTVTLPKPVKARYFKFVATHAVEKNHAVVAELGVIAE